MAVAKETTFNDFFSFAGGHMTDDTTINSWIRKGVQSVRSGKPHFSSSTGDTSVVVLRHGELDESHSIEVMVSTSSGVSRVSLYGDHEEPTSYYRELAEKGGPVK